MYGISNKKKVVETFAKNLPIKRRWFHNFCWLRYNQDDNTAQLAFSTEKECEYFGKINKDQDGGEPVQVKCNNPNIFFEKDDTMLMACNYLHPQTTEMHYLWRGADNNNSQFKITLNEESKVTIVDFARLNDNTIYMVGTEGEQGKSKVHEGHSHTNVCYLWALGDTDLKKYDAEVKEDQLKRHFLDIGEKQVEGGSGRKAWVSDGYCKVTPKANELSGSCTGNKYLTWHFTDKSGELVPELKKGHKSEDTSRRSLLQYYQVSFDRESLWAWGLTGIDNTVRCQFYRNSDKTIESFWFLWHLVKDSAVEVKEGEEPTLKNWNHADLHKAASLIE